MAKHLKLSFQDFRHFHNSSQDLPPRLWEFSALRVASDSLSLCKRSYLWKQSIPSIHEHVQRKHLIPSKRFDPSPITSRPRFAPGHALRKFLETVESKLPRGRRRCGSKNRGEGLVFSGLVSLENITFIKSHHHFKIIHVTLYLNCLMTKFPAKTKKIWASCLRHLDLKTTPHF